MINHPNFLVIMSDEHAAKFSSTYGHPIVKTPNMDRLAETGVTFENGYCNSPLCVPSRGSFMTGRFVSRCEMWDNTKPLPVDAVTWPYLLRAEGYDTALSGKMHMLGPDSLHGFAVQIAEDPHLREPLPHFRWSDGIPVAAGPWDGVAEANPGRSPMIDADDAIEEAAIAYLEDPARKANPFALCVGFIAPHFPFIVPEPFFSRYWPDNCDLPDIPRGHLDSLPAPARRLRRMFGLDGPWSDEEVKRARAAYYGLCTYMDAKLGRLLDALQDAGLAQNTVVIYTSDHGDMLGEHGLWRKMCFYEQSAHIPMQVAWPGRFTGGQRVIPAVSNIDLVATMLELAGVDSSRWNLDGVSLRRALEGDASGLPDIAISEHFAHGTDRAMGMVRSDRWKLCYGHGDPPELELYDLVADPGEFNNLATSNEHAATRDRLLRRLLDTWGDPDELTARIVASQEGRAVVRGVSGPGVVF